MALSIVVRAGLDSSVVEGEEVIEAMVLLLQTLVRLAESKLVEMGVRLQPNPIS